MMGLNISDLIMKRFIGLLCSLSILVPVTASAQNAPKLEGTYKAVSYTHLTLPTKA